MDNHDQNIETRRDFIRTITRYGMATVSLPMALQALGFISNEAYGAIATPKEVKFYRKLDNKRIQCLVCPLDCILNDGETCFCRTRNNRDGVLYSFAYNNPCILKLDPIEKMPLHHYLPGERTLSIATGGCNLRCLYCQNWQQSQVKPEKLKTFRLDADKAKKITITKKLKVISYTYTEPVVFSEYITNIASHTRPGIRNIAATALYINPTPLKDLCRHIDAFSITLKGFSDKFYRNVCGQPLKPILKAIELVKKQNVWFELVNLVVPTYNDSDREIKNMCRWIKRNLGKDVPVHYSRFVPQYRLNNLPRTPLRTLERARDITLAEGIRYVYISNVAPHNGNNTYCASCKKLIIERLGFKVLHNRVRNGKCPDCRHKIPGIWDGNP